MPNCVNKPILKALGEGQGTYSTTSATDSLEQFDRETLKHPSGGGTTTSIVNSEELANILNERMVQREGGNNQRLAIMLGMLTKDKEHPIKANIPEKDRSQFSMKKYKFLLDAPFEISNRCCNVMKKEPAHKYHKETGRNPITGQMASESRLRTQKWMQNGCNGYDLKIPTSNPMAFWTEQDVLEYIKIYLEKPLQEAWSNIYNPKRRKRKRARKQLRQFNYRKNAICSVYGEIVEDTSGTNEVEGQLTISDIEGFENMELFDAKRLPLKTTGCSRTGCMFCGFGCHLEKEGEGRFERMKETHPKQYDYIMRTKEQGGLNYKEVIDWINENGNLNIKY